MAREKKPSGAQFKKIRAIKAKHYSASYEKRLIRGVLSGKSRQQARGHHVGEHRERAAREREENEGLTVAEIKSVRHWYEVRFNPNGREGVPDVEDVIDFARSEGISHFREYQKTWNEARRVYIKELANGTYASRGMGHLEALTDMAGVRSHGGVEWLYYH